MRLKRALFDREKPWLFVDRPGSPIIGHDQKRSRTRSTNDHERSRTITVFGVETCPETRFSVVSGGLPHNFQTCLWPRKPWSFVIVRDRSWSFMIVHDRPWSSSADNDHGFSRFKPATISFFLVLIIFYRSSGLSDRYGSFIFSFRRIRPQPYEYQYLGLYISVYTYQSEASGREKRRRGRNREELRGWPRPRNDECCPKRRGTGAREWMEREGTSGWERGEWPRRRRGPRSGRAARAPPPRLETLAVTSRRYVGGMFDCGSSLSRS